MASFKKKNKILWIISFALIAILAIGLITTISRVNRNETTNTLGGNSLTYSVHMLDDKGEVVQGTSSITTKSFYKADGLKCEIKEKATIEYKVFFYDEDLEFISATDTLTEDFDTVEENAKYFKIMITPTNDAEVSFFEISTYGSQLIVTFNK